MRRVPRLRSTTGLDGCGRRKRKPAYAKRDSHSSCPRLSRASMSYRRCTKGVDGRDIGERSDAVLRTTMPGHDEGISRNVAVEQLDRDAFGRAQEGDARARPHRRGLAGEFDALGLELGHDRV